MLFILMPHLCVKAAIEGLFWTKIGAQKTLCQSRMVKFLMGASVTLSSSRFSEDGAPWQFQTGRRTANYGSSWPRVTLPGDYLRTAGSSIGTGERPVHSLLMKIAFSNLDKMLCCETINERVRFNVLYVGVRTENQRLTLNQLAFCTFNWFYLWLEERR